MTRRKSILLAVVLAIGLLLSVFAVKLSDGTFEGISGPTITASPDVRLHEPEPTVSADSGAKMPDQPKPTVEIGPPPVDPANIPPDPSVSSPQYVLQQPPITTPQVPLPAPQQPPVAPNVPSLVQPLPPVVREPVRGLVGPLNPILKPLLPPIVYPITDPLLK